VTACWYLERIDKQDAQKISSKLEKKLYKLEEEIKNTIKKNDNLSSELDRHDTYYKNILREYIQRSDDAENHAKNINNKLKKHQKECKLLKEHLRNKKGNKRAERDLQNIRKEIEGLDEF
jgi:uncharacterized phage infection (PIP) family protein YhgE